MHTNKPELENRTVRIMQAVTLLLFTALAVRAWADRPVVQATRAQQPPTIDGKLDDACWSNAQPVTEFLVNNGNKPAAFSSRARVIYDDEALYIAVRCEEPEVKNLQTRPLPRDHSDVFRTDCIEIMLDPGRSQSDYYHLGVNASGSVADRACTQGGHIGDMSWDAEVTAASFVGDTYWSCEVAIPFFGLGLSSKVGATWGLNICREKKQPAEDSSIAEQGAFNIASRFAELRGIEADLSRYCHQLGPVKTQQVLKDGKLEVSLVVPLLNGTGKDAQVLLDGWLVSPTGKVTVAKTMVTPPRDKELPVTLGPFRLEEQGDYTCHVRVADPITKKPLAVRKSILPVRYVPVTIDLIEPWYRDSIFATQQIKKVVLEVGVNMSAAELQGTSLAVRISETGSSKAIARNLVTSVKPKNRLTFDAVVLPEARMDLVASLKDRAGKIVAETSHPLRKLPRQTGEVWLGKDLNWHVDGKPFFLNGAWNYPEDFVPDYNAFSQEKPGDVKLLDTSIMNEVYYKVKSLRAESLSEEDAEFCRDYARNARKNPKLFGYYVSDEPEGNNFKAKVLEQIYQVFADEDPYHPVIISNDSMEGMHAYARCADINGL
ncbi:MAG: carbohydrate binding family 9 domain-containing protein, partial [Armatimonadetes bacterium]|nr:carbohydrate binding family 9 domain-containing protein [Armatimonadota bacterium]